jgi:hypothetical protein
MADRPHKWTEAEAEAMMHLAITAGNRLRNDEPLLVMPKKAAHANRAPQEGPPSDESNEPLREGERALGQLVDEFADAARARICRCVVSGLRRFQLSLAGENSILRTAWDDICVQMQTEQSFHWETAYIPTIEQFISDEIKKLSQSEKRAIWLQSEEGTNWLIDLDFPTDGESGYDGVGIPYDDENVIAMVLESVLAEAGRYENSRIRAYIDNL